MEKEMEIIPKMGMTVAYIHSSDEGGGFVGMTSPAIIQNSYLENGQRYLDLCVLSNTSGILFFKRCVQGTHWNWLSEV